MDEEELADIEGSVDIEGLSDIEKSILIDIVKLVVICYKYQYYYKRALPARDEFEKLTFTHSQWKNRYELDEPRHKYSKHSRKSEQT